MPTALLCGMSHRAWLPASGAHASGVLGEGREMTPEPTAGLQIVVLLHQDVEVAGRVQDLIELAAIQESRLVGLTPTIPDLSDIRSSPHVHLGALSPDGALQGLLCLGQDDEAEQVAIHTLVVRPSSQRRGIARALVLQAQASQPAMRLAVVTAAANLPALALYRQLGFEVYRRGLMSGSEMPVFKLRRTAHNTMPLGSAGPP